MSKNSYQKRKQKKNEVKAAKKKVANIGDLSDLDILNSYAAKYDKDYDYLANVDLSRANDSFVFRLFSAAYCYKFVDDEDILDDKLSECMTAWNTSFILMLDSDKVKDVLEEEFGSNIGRIRDVLSMIAIKIKYFGQFLFCINGYEFWTDEDDYYGVEVDSEPLEDILAEGLSEKDFDIDEVSDDDNSEIDYDDEEDKENYIEKRNVLKINEESDNIEEIDSNS